MVFRCGGELDGQLDAVLGGSTDYLGSTAAPLSLTVTATTTATTTITITITSTVNPSSAGQSVIYTAVVNPVAPATGTPTATVTFDEGGTPITGCTSLTLSSAAAAVCPANMPLAGTFSITATYNGSADFAGSVSPVLSQVVEAGLLTVQDVQAAGNPSASGVTLSPVTLGSSLANPSAVDVTFSNDQFAQAVGTLNSVSVTDGRGTEPGWTVTPPSSRAASPTPPP